jgi:hypothetical protein
MQHNINKNMGNVGEEGGGAFDSSRVNGEDEL